MDRAAEAVWEWDWDGDPVDRSLTPARLTPDGELEPLAVDESLTSLLFAPRAAVGAPRAEPAPSRPVEPERAEHRGSADLQGALFEVA